MISWQKISESKWIFETRGKQLNLSSKEAVIAAACYEKIPDDDIVHAFHLMDTNNHNYCQFGNIRKSLIFTGNK